MNYLTSCFPFYFVNIHEPSSAANNSKVILITKKISIKSKMKIVHSYSIVRMWTNIGGLV